MDDLTTIIDTLKKDERTGFRQFLERRQSRSKRKDQQLFDLLIKHGENKSAREYSNIIYGKENTNAYHALRKRLYHQITQYVMLDQMENDDTSESHIVGLHEMGVFLTLRNQVTTGKKFLLRAIKQAESNQYYRIIDLNLNFQIRHAHELDLDIEPLIKKWESNKVLLEEDDKINMAYSIIRQKLKETRITGSEIDITQLSENVINQIGLSTDKLQDPKTAYRISQIIRSTILNTKDYRYFDDFITKVYIDLLKNSSFEKKDHFYHLSLLYMLSHVNYRNRNFEKALKYAEKMGETLKLYKGLYSQRFLPKYVLLKSAIFSFSWKNKEAIDLLNETLQNEQLRLDSPDRINMYLNLAVYYFQAQEYSKANFTLLQIHQSEAWCEKKMGKEWRLRKNMIEIITQVEMENEEIALSRIRSVENYFSDFLNQERHLRVRAFIRAIKAYIERPESVITGDYIKKVEGDLRRQPADREDLQAMTFYCWIKSKMLKKDYYDVLVETVQTFGKSA